MGNKAGKNNTTKPNTPQNRPQTPDLSRSQSFSNGLNNNNNYKTNLNYPSLEQLQEYYNQLNNNNQENNFYPQNNIPPNSLLRVTCNYSYEPEPVVYRPITPPPRIRIERYRPVYYEDYYCEPRIINKRYKCRPRRPKCYTVKTIIKDTYCD